MADTANLSLLEVKLEFQSKFFHRCFIITSVIQCKIAELITNFKLLDNLNNLHCNVLARVSLCKLRQAKNQLLWPVIGILEYTGNTIQGIAVPRLPAIILDINLPWALL